MLLENEIQDGIGQVDESRGSGSGKWGVLLLAIVFFPATIVAFVFSLLLRKGRLRFSVILTIAIILDLLIIIRFNSSGGFTKLWENIQNSFNGSSSPSVFIEPYMFFCVIIGSIIGLAYVAWAARQMVANPWKLTIKSSWMYRFSYRRTPWQYFSRKSKSQKLRKGSLKQVGKAPLGLNEESGKDEVVYRYDDEAIKHTLITGLPGSGKSITMMSMMKSDIEEGKPVVAVDFKRDPELASKLATWAKENGRDFFHFVNGDSQTYDIANSPGQSFYNPLAAGTPTSKADMLLSMREYDTASAVYKAAMAQVLQIVFNMEHYVTLYKRRQLVPTIDWESGGFYTLVSILSGNNLNELADQCVGTPIEAEAFALATAAGGKTQERHAIEELRGQLRTITASEYGPWMKLRSGSRNIDLFDLTSKGGAVTLFSLNSDSEPEFAKYMGAIILADLTSVSAKRRNEDAANQVHVYVDEFQIVNPDSIKGLFQKSRASHMAITLAQQSLEQIVSSSSDNGEAYLGAVLDTCGNFIVHFGSTEPSAIRFSEILGKDNFTSYTASHRNESFFGRLNWSNKRDQRIMTREEERWIYPPQKFMRLESPSAKNNYKSTAVVVNKSSSEKNLSSIAGAKARRVWMIPDAEVLQKYYTRDRSKVFVAPEEKVPTPLDDAISKLEIRNSSTPSTPRKRSSSSFDELSKGTVTTSLSTGSTGANYRNEEEVNEAFENSLGGEEDWEDNESYTYHPYPFEEVSEASSSNTTKTSSKPRTEASTKSPNYDPSNAFGGFGIGKTPNTSKSRSQSRPSVSSFEQLVSRDIPDKDNLPPLA